VVLALVEVLLELQGRSKNAAQRARWMCVLSVDDADVLVILLYVTVTKHRVEFRTDNLEYQNNNTDLQH